MAVRPSFFPGASESGGVENYVQGLAAGLSALDGDERYEFVGSRLQHEALSPFLSRTTSFVTLPDTLRSSHLPGPLHGHETGEGRGRVPSKGASGSIVQTGSSPDAVEQDAYSVVHYPAPSGELTRHPNVYQPWDLQHLHFPEFFSADQLRGREVWRVCSERATYVLVTSEFVRDDVIAALRRRFRTSGRRGAGRSHGTPRGTAKPTPLGHPVRSTRRSPGATTTTFGSWKPSHC